MTFIEGIQPANATGDPELILFVVIVIIIIAGVIVLIYFWDRCPWCKHYGGWRTTGETKTEKVPFYGTRFTVETKYEEWLCSHCGYREWKQEDDGNGVGGGG